MNTRNVEALTALINEYESAPSHYAVAGLADFLASHGVLVPSALTDQEVADLFDVPPSHAATRREYLEQLAKGEQ